MKSGTSVRTGTSVIGSSVFAQACDGVGNAGQRAVVAPDHAILAADRLAGPALALKAGDALLVRGLFPDVTGVVAGGERGRSGVTAR